MKEKTLEILLKINLEEEDYDKAIETARRLREPRRTEALSKVLKTFLKYEWLDSHEVAKLLSEPQRTKILSKVLRFHIKKGRLEESKEAAKFLNRDLTVKEILDILWCFYNKGLDHVIRKVADELPEQLRTNELVKMVDLHMNKYKSSPYDTFHDAECIAYLLPEPYKTEKLARVFDHYLKKDMWYAAQKVAAKLSEPKRTEKLIKLIEARIDYEAFKEAKKTINLLSEPQRSDFLKVL